MKTYFMKRTTEANFYNNNYKNEHGLSINEDDDEYNEIQCSINRL